MTIDKSQPISDSNLILMGILIGCIGDRLLNGTNDASGGKTAV